MVFTVRSQAWNAGSCGAHRRVSRTSNQSSRRRLVMVSGSGPDSAVRFSRKVLREVRFPISAGTSPVRPSFRSSDRWTRLASAPSSGGIRPAKSVSSSHRYRRDESCPSQAGIGPVRSLPARDRSSRRGSRFSASGIRPVSPLFRRFKRITRPSLSVSTPCHVQIGKSSNQLVRTVHIGPPMVW